MRLLVTEDDPTIAGFVRQGLEELGYAVDVVGDGKTGEVQAASGYYDVLILDIMLSGQSGIEVCRRLRQRGVATPILMLTALTSTGSKVEGLLSGADDYLVKPFDSEELAARVQALLRRGQAGEGSLLRFEDLESAHFLVRGLIGIIMQMVTSFLTSFAIVRERELGILEQLFATPVGRSGLMLGKFDVTPNTRGNDHV